MRARVPKGLRNDKPLLYLTLDQWVVLSVFAFVITNVIEMGLYELLVVLIPLTPIFMFVKIKREKIWVFIFKVIKYYFRPKKVMRKDVYWLEE